jgi:hypothetical protein
MRKREIEREWREEIKKKKITKLPKGSLRHLAPRNAPTIGNNQKFQQGNTSPTQGNEGQNNVQQGRNQGQVQGQRKNQGGNGQFRNQKGKQFQGNQQKRNNNQGQKGGNVGRNQGNNEQQQQNRGNQSKGKSYRVKNTQQTENKSQDEQNDDAIFEVIVKNTLTGKQILYTKVTQENLNSFPSEVKSKFDFSE